MTADELDWPARLHRAVEQTLAARRNRLNLRRELQQRRVRGLRQRHTRKLDTATEYGMAGHE